MIVMPTPTHEKAVDHLSTALHELLAATVLMGGLPDDIPDDALDAALRIDPALQEARKGVQDALQTLQSSGMADSLFVLEEAVNALAARCAEAGYRVGRITRGI